MSTFFKTTSTATGSVAAPTDLPTRTGGTEVLNRVAVLRDRVGDLHSDVAELDGEVRRGRLDAEAARLVKNLPPTDLLERLSRNYALSWRTIAALVGVSPAAVRKWRRGETVRPAHSRSIAHAVALMAMLKEALPPIAEPAAWIETPISAQSHLRPLDLYVAKRDDLVFEFATERLGPRVVLDRFDPEWRLRYAADSQFETVLDVDGGTTLREH